MKRQSPDSWTSQDSADLYSIADWGADQFCVSDNGELLLQAHFEQKKVQVSLTEVISQMHDRGLDMPVLLRVENILEQSITRLNQAFRQAISDADYQNKYRGVFPIKVNQQCQVIKEIAATGRQFNHGLEAGSKAELIIALSQMDSPDGCIICNGYKDAEFIDLGLHARKLGINCFFVIENPIELPIIIERSQALGVSPLIGVRLKLTSKVDGHWSEDSGDRSIFGLTTTQLIDMVDQLKTAQMLDCLQLLHFHLGSQIPNIRNIRTGVREACRYYVNLIEEGAPLGYLDLGGGLAVDYDGSRSNDTHSKNYNLDEYCIDVVEAIMETLDPHQIAHPVIITESGRATVAHSSILLFDVLGVNSLVPGPLPEALPENSHELLNNLQEVRSVLNRRNLQECYNDAVYYRDEVRERFHRGLINLRARSLAEDLFADILQRIVQLLPDADRPTQELEELLESMADIYYSNFSIFQSLPDSWAIDQVFPVMPVHRLNEAPTRDAVIADITCDCDGKIDHFINGKRTLPLHPLKADDPYYLGIFLVGAYQETLGDLHNLFGDTHVVSIRINENGSYDFVKELQGDTIADVLSYVEYYPKSLLDQFRTRAERAVRQGKISVPDRQKMLTAFSDSLRGYTYFEK